MASQDSFGAKGTLDVDGQVLRDLPPRRGEGEGLDVESLPFSLKVLLENLLRTEDGADITADHIKAIAGWDAERRARPGDPVHAGPRDHAGLHRRPLRRRPRHHARGDGRARRRRHEDQPARARRDGHRPLRDRRRLRHAAGLRAQRRDRVRAQPRALPVPALGPGRVRRLQGRPARHRHRPPGQHRAPRPRRVTRARRRGLPRHLRRHRLPHHDGQRHRRGRLGRRRHRGRGGDARPAGLHADPARRRLQALRRPARGLDRHRPGAHDHRDAARARRGRQVRRVLRRGRLRAAAGQPRHHRQHEPGVRLHHRRLPDRRPDRSTTSRLTGRTEEQLALVEAYAKEQGLWHDPSAEPRYSERLELDLSTVVPSLAGPKRPQDRVEVSVAKDSFRAALADYVDEGDSDPDDAAEASGYDEAVEESFPASDSPSHEGGNGKPVHADAPHDAGRPTKKTKDLPRRPGGRDRPRRRRDRRDHLVHQHLQPDA